MMVAVRGRVLLDQTTSLYEYENPLYVPFEAAFKEQRTDYTSEIDLLLIS